MLLRAQRVAAALAVAIVAAAAPQPVAADASQVTLVQSATLPATPTDPAWAKLTAARVPLVLQDMVEPRLLVASTPEVRVRGLTDGERVAFLLEWDDTTDNDMQKPSQFSDACAVQLPAVSTPDVPAPQMGEPGRSVEISYWRAAWQAAVDGRADTVQAIYPNATVDHYPFDAEPLKQDSGAQQAMAKRYAPARALGNQMAGPREQPVEDLLAEGPGSLSPALKRVSTGRGKRTPQGWAVMIVRPLPQGLASGKRTQVAFAVWNGTSGEVGARKMRSAWLPLAREAGK